MPKIRHSWCRTTFNKDGRFGTEQSHFLKRPGIPHKSNQCWATEINWQTRSWWATSLFIQSQGVKRDDKIGKLMLSLLCHRGWQSDSWCAPTHWLCAFHVSGFREGHQRKIFCLVLAWRKQYASRCTTHLSGRRRAAECLEANGYGAAWPWPKCTLRGKFLAMRLDDTIDEVVPLPIHFQQLCTSSAIRIKCLVKLRNQRYPPSKACSLKQGFFWCIQRHWCIFLQYIGLSGGRP